MDETTLKIAIASFFHDIGKFAGSAVFALSKDEFDSRAADFLPLKNGRYTHSHALYTAEFISRFIDILPDEFNRPWGEGDGLVKLAASHHSPASPMEWIIAEADRISSGMDRKDYDAGRNESVSIGDYEKTRLVPLLECLDCDGKSDFSTSEKFRYAYSLSPLAPETIFAQPKLENASVDRHTAKKAYIDLFEKFSLEMKKILHRNNIQLWFEHFESLLMQYASHIPAARVGNVIPDVSLYDHLKTTSALATALYCYHKSTDTLSVAEVKNEDTEKFLLVSADFHGIQNFIFSGYGDTRKYRSKLLRGRSFYVSVAMELAAELLCREIGLPFTAVVLNAGGKFTLLAPNTVEAAEGIEKVRKEVEKWFVQMTYGESGISFSMVPASPGDFKSGRFPVLQDKMNFEMARKKSDRIDMDVYGGVVENYFDGSKEVPCPFCGKRPVIESSGMRGGQPSCNLCRDHVFLGENLVKKNTLAVLDKNVKPLEKGLATPLFDRFQLVFPDTDMQQAADENSLLKYWTLGLGNDSAISDRSAMKFFRGYVPVYSDGDQSDERIEKFRDDEGENLLEQILDNAPKTLGHISALAKNIKPEGGLSGVEALGVLKADVDNLGLLMACGLRENLYSISRIATLSRQLNNFFTVYLPHLLGTDEAFKNIYTVFAGGDDLFLIGPWNRIMDFAPVLAEKFAIYACGNRNITLSAGISFHKAHTPVNAMADAAESALVSAKQSGRNRLTVFDEIVKWEDTDTLYNITTTIERWIEKEFISPTMLYRLNAFVDMANREKMVTAGKSEIHIHDMNCTRWRALLAYSVERNVLKTSDPGERQNRIAEVRNDTAQWLSDWGGKLRIPLWYVQYNRR